MKLPSLRKAFRQIDIANGAEIPKWHGVAWYDWSAARIICYPIPLNILVCYTRSFYIWLKHGYRNKFTDAGDAYNQGLQVGYHQGIQVGRKENADLVNEYNEMKIAMESQCDLREASMAESRRNQMHKTIADIKRLKDQSCVRGHQSAMMRVCELGTHGCSIRHETDPDKLKAEIRQLRHILFMAHGDSEHYLYGDDGCRQCNTCHIDFNWDSPQEMELKYNNWAMTKLAELRGRGIDPFAQLHTDDPCTVSISLSYVCSRGVKGCFATHKN